ncbi:MAG: DUF6576 domain-containing protein [Desertimonas sp.]
MAGRFSFSAPGGRGVDRPWFRVGTVDVTTTVLVTALAAVSMFVYAVDKTVLVDLVLFPAAVRDGEVWRMVSWPLVNPPEIWTVITLAIFWYFGGMLEAEVGRNRFLAFVGYLTILPAVLAVVLNTNDLNGIGLYGLDLVELGVFLAFVASYPFVRFFFGVPGWAIGAVIVGLQFLQYTGDRRTGMVLVLLAVVAIALLGARALGLADDLQWVPALPVPGLSRRTGRRPRRSRKRSQGQGGVVAGPWARPEGQTPAAVRSMPQPPAGPSSSDQAELDRLLDKISANGMDALTSDEKRRLNELSKRMRGPR